MTLKLEDQVCTLEQAVKLKELGVAQESLFWWTQDMTPRNPNEHEYGTPQEDMHWRIFYGQRSRISTSSVHSEYSAFTVAELGEMLPSKLCYLGEFPTIEYDNLPKYVEAHGVHYRGLKYSKHQRGKTEAQARARMLIYLLENKLITI